MASESDRVVAAPATGVVVVTGAASDARAAGLRPRGRRPRVSPVWSPSTAGSLKRLPAGIERHQVDLATADLKPLFEGATTVVHLAQADGPGRGEADRPRHR